MKEEIVKWTKEYFDTNDASYAIIGISGGKDSFIAAKVLTEALGTKRVIGVSLPNGKQKDMEDVNKVFSVLGIKRIDINISRAYFGLIQDLTFANLEINEMVRTNLPARLRMCSLYAVAANYPKARVVNTCNRSEDYVGWATKFGDAAGDFSLFQNLTVREVIALGDELGLPYELVHKTPDDGMCGCSDEEKLGFTYDELDDYLLKGIKGKNYGEILRLYKAGKHKMEPMPAFKKAGAK